MTTAVMTATTQSPTIGIIGGGFMARVHSRAARTAGARLAGISSSSPASSERAAAQYGFDRAYDTAESLIADPAIDLVHICTPNATHLEYALAAIAAGKHVICEKPLATSAADSARLVAAASERGVVATVPFAYRFHPMVREARARIAAGTNGRTLSVSGSYLQDWLISANDDNWRVDTAAGGPSRAFADIGSHLVDLVEFIGGDQITAIAAVTSTVHPDRVANRAVATEDIAALTVRFAAGAVGTLLVSQVAAGRKNRLLVEFSGSEASVEFNQEEPETLWIGRREANAILWPEPAFLAPDAARLAIVPAGHPMGYQDAFNAFVADSYAAISGPAPDGLPRFDDGLRAAIITEAVLESAATGTWVDVPSRSGDASASTTSSQHSEGVSQ